MKFEWDVRKNAANRSKHGIDFIAARDLWLDDDRIDIHAPHPLEKRSILIARLKGKLWTAIYTMRGNTIRLISVRRSREKEVALYEKSREG